MTSVLFVTWDGGGNVPPMIEIALEHQRKGGDARFLGHAGQRAAIEGAGLRFEEYRHAKPWSVLTPRAGLRANLAYAAVFTDRGIGEDVIESLRRERADRVVVDGLLVGALAALGSARIPYVILVHTLRSIMYPALLHGPLGLIMRLRRFRPDRLYLGAEAELVLSEPALDAGADQLPASVHFVGAVVPAVSEALPNPELPVVLVSLSTTYVEGQDALLQRIIDATAPMHARVIVTSGPAVDQGQLRAAANTEIREFAPHTSVMATASLVIGHGGHGTTMLALAHGLPLLIIPINPAFDQPGIGRMVADNGFGLTLPKGASADRLRDAAIELLSNPTYGAAARAVGPSIRSRRAAHTAADVLAAAGPATDSSATP